MEGLRAGRTHRLNQVLEGLLADPEEIVARSVEPDHEDECRAQHDDEGSGADEPAAVHQPGLEADDPGAEEGTEEEQPNDGLGHAPVGQRGLASCLHTKAMAASRMKRSGTGMASRSCCWEPTTPQAFMTSRSVRAEPRSG